MSIDSEALSALDEVASAVNPSEVVYRELVKDAHAPASRQAGPAGHSGRLGIPAADLTRSSALRISHRPDPDATPGPHGRRGEPWQTNGVDADKRRRAIEGVADPLLTTAVLERAITRSFRIFLPGP